MALVSDTNFGSYDHEAKDRTVCTLSRSVVFASGSDTLPRNTPLAYNTSTNEWTVFTQGGTNGTNLIRAFVWPEAITLSASGEVIGTVMMEGTINYGDATTAEILAVLGGGATAANVGTAMVGGDPSLRELGIVVEGLSGVR